MLRGLDFDPPGDVYFTSGPDEDWHQTYARHRDILTWTPTRTVHGYLRYSKIGGPDNGTSWPHIENARARYHRPLLARYVPDAFGLQLLTDAHLERAHDLSDWDITHLADGRHLVASKNLDGWFGGQPGNYGVMADDALVAKARADFGDMILTLEVIERENPWPNWPD
jgi:hypothetical protein